MFDLSFPQLVCPFAIWMTLVCFFTSVCFATREGFRTLKRLHQIPCSGCAFSTRDYRLKCTVRPYQAFSEQAVCCLDFEASSPSPSIIGVRFLMSRMKDLQCRTYHF